MGNKLGRRRQVVDERYTRPQGLYAHKDVDHKKLRKLILESKLAPCYPGEEELCNDHEECPICFLSYPSLNRSRCCTKGICTECFLQMKDPNSVHPTQCPFCKTANYAVEYRGAKTKEEKGLEQIEEQQVIEAKIRMRRQELQDEEERMQRRLESGASSSKIALAKLEHDSVTVQSSTSLVERENLGRSTSQHVIRRPTHGRTNSDDEFDLDLEDIMIMEAIWLSVQENKRLKNPMYENVGSSRHAVEGQCSSSQALATLAGSTSSPSGGLASAIAALAERQQMSGEPSGQQSQNISALCTRPGNDSFSSRLDVGVGTYPPEQGSGIVSQDCRMGLMRDDAESGTDSDSHVAVARTSYASSIVTEDSDDVSVLLPPPPPPPPPPSLRSDPAAAWAIYASFMITEDSDDVSVLLPPPPPPLPPEFFGGSYARISGETMPEIFEEQMMFFKEVPEARDESDAAEERTSCASFVTVEDSGTISTSIQPPSPPPLLPPSPPPLGAGGSFTNVSGPLAPEGF